MDFSVGWCINILQVIMKQCQQGLYLTCFSGRGIPQKLMAQYITCYIGDKSQMNLKSKKERGGRGNLPGCHSFIHTSSSIVGDVKQFNGPFIFFVNISTRRMTTACSLIELWILHEGLYKTNSLMSHRRLHSSIGF